MFFKKPTPKALNELVINDKEVIFVKKINESAEDAGTMIAFRTGEILAVIKRAHETDTKFFAVGVKGFDIDNLGKNEVFWMAPNTKQYKIVNNVTSIGQSRFFRCMFRESEKHEPWATLREKELMEEQELQDKEDKEIENQRQLKLEQKAVRRRERLEHMRSMIKEELVRLAKETNPQSIKLIEELVELKCNETYVLAKDESELLIKDAITTLRKHTDKRFTALIGRIKDLEDAHGILSKKLSNKVSKKPSKRSPKRW